MDLTFLISFVFVPLEDFNWPEGWLGFIFESVPETGIWIVLLQFYFVKP